MNACGFFLDNYLTKFFYNLFIDLKKPLIPTKFFTNKEAALQWLSQFKFLN
jgi:hypothetical protein